MLDKTAKIKYTPVQPVQFQYIFYWRMSALLWGENHVICKCVAPRTEFYSWCKHLGIIILKTNINIIQMVAFKVLAYIF